MEVKQEETGHKGSFYVEQEDQRLAEMTYSWAGNDRIIIDHTEVSDKLRGMGVGLRLVEQAVTFAREKGISIIPLCPFARSVFNKKSDWKDVL
ncbi:GNAT family N-acetyltransferase [Marinoscillum sp.]|uniref:GNAT family N-acetyltransferase n=1 Tax=Marinoscillum sp. TaxID=2024838 RepID=UPI003BA98BBE